MMKKMLLIAALALGFVATHQIQSAAASARDLRRIQSLTEVQSIVEDLMGSGMQPNEILVSFDFDGTLNGRKKLNEEGRAVLDQAAAQETLSVLAFLDANNVPYFVNTAAEDTAGVYTAYKVLPIRAGQRPGTQINLPAIFGTSCIGFSKRAQKHEFGGATINHCDHIMSSGYDKDLVLRFAISQLDQEPKICIHVDDSATIALRMYNDFSQHYPVISLFYPLVVEPALPEPGQEEASAQIDEIIASQTAQQKPARPVKPEFIRQRGLELMRQQERTQIEQKIRASARPTSRSEKMRKLIQQFGG